jgi:hypothetical protein
MNHRQKHLRIITLQIPHAKSILIANCHDAAALASREVRNGFNSASCSITPRNWIHHRPCVTTNRRYPNAASSCCLKWENYAQREEESAELSLNRKPFEHQTQRALQ